MSKNKKILISTGILYYLFSVFSIQSSGQATENLFGEIQQIPSNATAQWISYPDLNPTAHNVIYFRKTFNVWPVPAQFIIHITADNTYRIFVNGKYAAMGPGKSDLFHWFYQTFDLAPLLLPDKNVIAVEVVNFGPRRAFAQFSHLTGLYIQGHTPNEFIVNTNGSTWKVFHNLAYYNHDVQWIFSQDVTGGFYVANPTDSIVASLMPWGWEKSEFDDSSWPSSVWLDNASIRGTQGAGGIFYPGGWLLYPGPIRVLREQKERFTSIIKMDGLKLDEGFLFAKNDLLIPPDKTITLWIDHKNMTVGFPEMILSKGRNSLIKVRYAETLYNQDKKSKPDRNDYKDKKFIGIPDFYLPDGSANQLFRPLSHRAFRFIQVQVTTHEQPLIIHDYYHMFTAYPLELRAAFESSDPELNKLFIPGWRTASICAQDLLMSDAYYEQMQYVGDSKIHNLSILFLSGNDDLVRNQLMQTDWSRFTDGLTLACAPNAFHLVIPYYSLLWIDMVYDYMMWSGDKKFVNEMSWGIENVLHWYDVRMEPNGMLGPVEWWNDMDWSPGFRDGTPPGVEAGNSATLTLQYAVSLEKAARIFEWLDQPEKTIEFSKKSKAINLAVKELCYDKPRGLFAETPAKKFYSQHTNILAVLSGAAEKEQEKEIMNKVITDPSLSQVALLFRYFLLEALKKSGLGDSIKSQLSPWDDMVNRGLTTFTEIPVTWENQRSDCHPWATTPVIQIFSGICGISPITPGYEKVMIEPSFGSLSSLKSTFPLKNGAIELQLEKNNKSNVTGSIQLPERISGTFRYGGKELQLKPGLNKIEL